MIETEETERIEIVERDDREREEAVRERDEREETERGDRERAYHMRGALLMNGSRTVDARLGTRLHPWGA